MITPTTEVVPAGSLQRGDVIKWRGAHRRIIKVLHSFDGYGYGSCDVTFSNPAFTVRVSINEPVDRVLPGQVV